MAMQRTLQSQTQYVPHGYEFEFILCQPDGSLVSLKQLDALNQNRPQWLDYEFLQLVGEIQSPVYHTFDGIRKFISTTQQQMQVIQNTHGIYLAPFSGIFDIDFIVREDYITRLPGREYYMEAWRNMRTHVRESNVFFNKCCGLHISFEINEADLVRMYNIANVLIAPLIGIFSSYGGSGSCLRPLHWKLVDHTIQPLWLTALSEYDDFTQRIGMPFTTVVPGEIVYKSWPWIRIKPFHNSHKTKKWRLELSMADMTFLPEQVSLLSEFIVRFMSVVASLPDFFVASFDASEMDYHLIQMCSSNSDWRNALTLNFNNQTVPVSSVLQTMHQMIVDVYGTGEATEMIERLLLGEKTGAEIIQHMGLTDQSLMRLLAYEQWMTTANDMRVAV